ncbi:MAG: hypothetical protein NVSMB27_39270 [Ktedonobacteraceae bacterium]
MGIQFRRFVRRLAITLFVISTLLLFSVSSVGASPTSTVFSFKNFELGAAPGTHCPAASGNSCTNGAAEPAIRADKAGNFYASSENGLGAGTDAWRSAPQYKGLFYDGLESPNRASQTNNTGLAPGGGDTDLAVAPQLNSIGNYNVYVASLTLANVDVSTSTSQGASWTLNPVGALIPGDDREWIAADMASKVCVSYHDVVTFDINVNCSYNAGKTFTQLASAFAGNVFLPQNNAIGNMVIDPNNHYIYQTFSGIHDATEVPCSQAGTCGYHTVWMAVSTDGGKTFTDHIVYNNPDTTVSYGHQFVNVSVDRAGNIYSVYSDNHNVYYSFSTNHGTGWTGPFQVNKTPSNTAIMPWSTANKAGHIDIVWYGTSYFQQGTPPDSYPSTAAWNVYFAQNLSATTAGSSFTQVTASPINHYGGVCEGGVSCTGNRDLYDDFGVAASPVTGLASIVYSDDQYTNDQNNPPQSGCTASVSNTGSCDHTSIATQTSGSGI